MRGSFGFAVVGMDIPGDGYAEEVEDEHGAGEEAHAEGSCMGQMMAAMMKMARTA